MKPFPRQCVRLALTASCVVTLSFPASAQVRRSKLDDVLRGAGGGRHRVIVQTRSEDRAALKLVLEQHGDVVRAEHFDLSALTVDLHGEDLAALESDPSVIAVSVDADVTAFGAPSSGGRKASRTLAPAGSRRQADAGGSTPEAMNTLRATLGLSGSPFTGAGINVAVVDSGIHPNQDLTQNIAGFWDFTRGGIPTRATDEYGHGTHVAGLIASTGIESNRQFAGVAPRVRLYGFKVLDEDGRGRASDVIRALEFIVANKRSPDPGAFKIDVINLSIGHPIFEPAETDPLVRAVESATRAGIIVIAAAGNKGLADDGTPGYAGITSPGNAPSAITIGALDARKTVAVTDDRVASFSSRGPTWFNGFGKPDLMAPGVSLTSDAPRFSSLFDRYPQLKHHRYGGRGNYGTLSGTSMASAVATGVASLALEASRSVNSGPSGLSVNALKSMLQYSALPLKNDDGQPYDTLTQGTGAINAPGVLALALAINPDMPVGAEWLRVRPQPSSLINGAILPWSQALIWDDNIVWGTDALTFNSPQWSDDIVWGTLMDDGDNIVWGTAAELDNIVWGTVTPWAADLAWSNRVIGLLDDADNIVWGTVTDLDADNIVWGTVDGDNIVWGTWEADNIVWGSSDLDNIVWGTFRQENDNIVWGTGASR